MDKLTTLRLDSNKFSGPIPGAWAPGSPGGGMTSLRAISVFGNRNMTGCLPVGMTGPGPSGSGFFLAVTGQPTLEAKYAAGATNITGYCTHL
jgi:hypothetical protein